MNNMLSTPAITILKSNLSCFEHLVNTKFNYLVTYPNLIEFIIKLTDLFIIKIKNLNIKVKNMSIIIL